MTDQNKSQQQPNIPHEYHGNIAPNLHNLESQDFKKHLVENNREMQQHYKEAGVSLSDFKPTQNVWKGNEKDLDPVLTSGDLGKDVFFTTAFERQQKGSVFEGNDKENHGNKGKNMGNLETSELGNELKNRRQDVVNHFKEANVTLSDFKPTQNVQKGKEDQLDPVLVSGDLGKDKFFTSAFERQLKGTTLGPDGEMRDVGAMGVGLHGNKGKNLGNIESTDLGNTLKNKQQEVQHHFKDANVKLSDFKPTQNVVKGHEKELDPVLVKGDLGKDKFFTSAFERQAKGVCLGEEGEFRDSSMLTGGLHGNKGKNLSNIESSEINETLRDKHEQMASHYKEANVTLSDFKPTQNVFHGHEKDLDPALIKGDLGTDKFFTAAFERQEKGGFNEEDNRLHGNKGANLGNLESEEMRKHIIDNNKKMASHYKEAGVTLSDFKPTQNIQKGHEKDLDKVLVSGDLGKDTFFTKAFENQAKIDEVGIEGYGHGNKGVNTSNLSSVDYTQHMMDNFDKSDQNVKNSHIIGDSFKPNHDIFAGRNMAKEPSNEEAFKGQSLEQVLEDTHKETPTA